jgi:hypothetical protein
MVCHLGLGTHLMMTPHRLLLVWGHCKQLFLRWRCNGGSPCHHTNLLQIKEDMGIPTTCQQQDQQGPYMVDHLSFIRQLVAIHLAEMDPLLSSLSYEVWRDGVFLGASSKTIFHVTEKAIKKEDMPAT